VEPLFGAAQRVGLVEMRGTVDDNNHRQAP
jgi:hypothetical protein